MRLRANEKGFGLLEFLVVVVVVVVVVIAARTITRKQRIAQAHVDNIAAALTPTTATIGTPYSGSIFSATGSTAATTTSDAGWLSHDQITGTLSGTPDGNDFGEFTVTFTTTFNGRTVSADATITVGLPTLTSVVPAEGFETPPLTGGASNDVDVTIGPAPVNGYDMTFEKEPLEGNFDGLQLPGPTSTDNAGNATIRVSESLGDDYKANVFIVLESTNADKTKIRLAPILSKTRD